MIRRTRSGALDAISEARPLILLSAWKDARWGRRFKNFLTFNTHMKLQELISLINTYQNIEQFAELNLLKCANQGNRYILNYSEQIL